MCPYVHLPARCVQHTNCKSGTIYFTATLLHKSDILCLFSVKDEFVDCVSELANTSEQLHPVWSPQQLSLQHV